MSEPTEHWPINEHFTDSTYPIKNLIIKGGSVKGVGYVGALLCLHQLGKLEELENVAGTSAGAITALLIALGFTVQEVIDKLVELDIEQLLDDNTVTKLRAVQGTSKSEARSVKGISRVYRDLRKQWAVSKTDKIQKWLEKLIADKTWAIIHTIQDLGVEANTDETARRNIATNLTFGELHQLRNLPEHQDKGFKNLYVETFNLKKQRSINFNYQQYPRVIIVDAVVASLSIPFLFVPHKIYVRSLTEGQEGIGGDANKAVHPRFVKDYFVDGGIAQNYPIKKFRNVPGTVGLYLASLSDVKFILQGVEPEEEEEEDEEEEVGEEEEVDEEDEEESFTDYGKTVLETVLSYHQLYEHRCKNDRRFSIYINTKNIGTFDFDLDEAKKNLLIQSGWEAVRAAYTNEAKERRQLDLECPFQIPIPTPPAPAQGTCTIN